MTGLWPVTVAVSLALLALSFVLPGAAIVTVLRILAVVGFLIAAVFAFPGVIA